MAQLEWSQVKEQNLKFAVKRPNSFFPHLFGPHLLEWDLSFLTKGSTLCPLHGVLATEQPGNPQKVGFVPTSLGVQH